MVYKRSSPVDKPVMDTQLNPNQFTHEAREANADVWDSRMGDEGNDFFKKNNPPQSPNRFKNYRFYHGCFYLFEITFKILDRLTVAWS